MFDYFYGQSGEMFSYFRVPKILFRDIKFKDLSTDAKTLYGILLDRMGLSVKNGWLDEQGRVYIIFPVQEVMDALGCADNKATKLFRELEKFGLIERKRRGLGKPNLIYVKNFADPRFRNREKNGSGAADSAQQETAKSRGNKTEWNKTEGSEPDPFSSDAESEPDERTRLEAYFMQSLEVDLLLRVCPDEEDTIDQIVNLLVDTCSSKRRMLRVAGGRQACGGRAQPIHEAECRPYPLCAEVSCGKYRTGTEHEAVSAGNALQCAHHHEPLLSEQDEPRLCAWFTESGVMLSQRKLRLSQSLIKKAV